MDYDYIIAGAGCAGLMLAYKLSMDEHFKNHSILLIDKDAKKSNDRTWCYWEEGSGPWDDILSCQWSKVYFGNTHFKKSIPTLEYSYKMIRGKDFYNKIFSSLEGNPKIKFVQEEVVSVRDTGKEVFVTTSHSEYKTQKVFSSLFNPDIIQPSAKYPYLKQHFVGWFVHTDEPVFDSSEAVFMDFDIAQKGNTRFMYVLPLSDNYALVEYTLFSEKLLPREEYEEAIQEYLLSRYGQRKYTIKEKEYGNIPMTCFPLELQNSRNVLYIGSAGGWSKPSTGFTFMMCDKNTDKLVSFLKSNPNLKKFSTHNIFRYLDNILLRVLSQHNESGAAIFTCMFKTNTLSRIFRFLDEKASLREILLVMIGVGHMHLFVKSVLTK